ncbi:uncharacterized protein LOC126317103 [Schistocerca gregaria]|uniref:uncharacterized protein LOC126317103 n=1 Tax=Schistocerca gregaria TaxID=7010 RepID=UPI00211E9577|nr:uncharacterized protein LOC126317103 [Schistocerca gregaria]
MPDQQNTKIDEGPADEVEAATTQEHSGNPDTLQSVLYEDFSSTASQLRNSSPKNRPLSPASPISHGLSKLKLSSSSEEIAESQNSPVNEAPESSPLIGENRKMSHSEPKLSSVNIKVRPDEKPHIIKMSSRPKIDLKVDNAIEGSMRKRKTIDPRESLEYNFEGKTHECSVNDSLLIQNIQNACRVIWNRPIPSLLVHTDLPRLSNGIEIIDELSSTWIFKGDGNMDTAYKVRSIIYAIAYYTDSPADAENLIELLDQCKNQDNDIIIQLSSFISKVVQMEKQPNCILVLKCINQAIMFPAVFNMKKQFGDLFEYRDVKGSWKVRISIYADFIEVRHRKSEKSYGTGAEENFSFVWLVVFKICLSQPKLDVSVSILDYILDKEMKSETQKQILMQMQPFLSESAQYMSIWKKPLRKLPVHRDFSLLCNRLSVFNYDGEPIYVTSPKECRNNSVEECLLKLAATFNPELIPHIQESIKNHFKESGDYAQMLSGVLHVDKPIPEDSGLASVMKFLNATMISPAIYKLHSILYDKLRYKDVRGTWYVHITVGPPLSIEIDNSSQIGRYHYVRILNRRCEKAYSSDPKDQFEFEWVLEFILDKEMKIKETNMGIVDFKYGPQTSEETKESVLKCLSPHFIPSSLQTSRSSMLSQDLLESTINEIQKLEKQIKQPITCYHPNMPHSIPISLLLDFIKNTIPEGKIIHLFKPNYSSKG